MTRGRFQRDGGRSRPAELLADPGEEIVLLGGGHERPNC
jgi:hypothetical protein